MLLRQQQKQSKRKVSSPSSVSAMEVVSENNAATVVPPNPEPRNRSTSRVLRKRKRSSSMRTMTGNKRKVVNVALAKPCSTIDDGGEEELVSILPDSMLFMDTSTATQEENTQDPLDVDILPDNGKLSFIY